MNISVGVEISWYSLMMWGWRKSFKFWISRRIFTNASLSLFLMIWRFNIFTATWWRFAKERCTIDSKHEQEYDIGLLVCFALLLLKSVFVYLKKILGLHSCIVQSCKKFYWFKRYFHNCRIPIPKRRTMRLPHPTHLVSSKLMNGNFDFSERPSSQCFAKDIVANLRSTKVSYDLNHPVIFVYTVTTHRHNPIRFGIPVPDSHPHPHPHPHPTALPLTRLQSTSSRPRGV